MKKSLPLLILIFIPLLIIYLIPQQIVNAAITATNPYFGSFTTNKGTYAQAVGPNGNIYFGGSFTKTGIYQGNGIPIKQSDGTLQQTVLPSAHIVGDIFSTISDTKGGWYVGGAFRVVGNNTSFGVIHINSDYSLDTNFNCTVQTQANTLALANGILYVGGSSSQATNLFSVDATTGVRTSWDPEVDGSVSTLAIDNGEIYVGGLFLNEENNSVHNQHFSAFTISNGNLDPAWAFSFDNTVTSILSNSGILYIGGSYLNVLGTVNMGRHHIASFNENTQTLNTWTASPGTPNAMTIQASSLFIASGSSLIGYSTSNGTASTWTTSVNGGIASINTLITSNGSIYLGGSFTTVNGTTRNNLASINPSDGSVASWDPEASDEVNALASYGTTIYAVGRLSFINAVSRTGLAEMNPQTGQLVNWDPQLNTGAVVMALRFIGNTLYVGGINITSVNNNAVTREGALAVDGTSGVATNWDPELKLSSSNTSTQVSALYSQNNTMYVGGTFDTADATTASVTRNNAASFDLTNGTVTSWDPNTNGGINSLKGINSSLYLGGSFTTINGSTNRNYVAAVDATTGSVQSFNPAPDNTVNDLYLSGTTVYVAGTFQNIAGTAQPGLAAFNTNSNALLPFNPGIETGNVSVNHVEILDSQLYILGTFQNINVGMQTATTRKYLASVDPISGIVSSWNPQIPQGYQVNPDSFIIANNGQSIFLTGSYNLASVSQSISQGGEEGILQFGIYTKPLTVTPSSASSTTLSLQGSVTSIGTVTANNTITTYTLGYNSPLIKGTGTPGATIQIAIHSNPIVKTTTIGANGLWSVQFTNIPDGSHTLQILEIDPSNPSNSLTLANDILNINFGLPVTGQNLSLILTIASLSLVLSAGGIIYSTKKKK